ncbi:MAG TPA: response regulator [Ktedonobacteraceae bacterium]|nr:response regulator [Ktedonobacteraceae bacterium]
MKIALLEDNPINSEYIQTILRMEGHQVFPHRIGDSLLNALQTADYSFPYDIALIDLLLPGTLSGLDVMHRIQQDYPAQHLPCIVLSAASQKELNRVQADFPQTPIIGKPFKRQQLIEAINMLVATP